MNCLFSSGLIGGLIGAFATLVAVGFAHVLEIRKRRIENNDIINAILQAIKTEIRCLQKKYNDSVGRQLEELDDSRPFLGYYYATEDYFTIYHQNSSLIGQIPNEKLRNSIVTVYLQMKGLLDTYKTNNRMIEQYEYYEKLASKVNPTGSDIENKEKYAKELLGYKLYLKASHMQAIEGSNRLIEEINDYLISRNKQCLFF